MASVVFIEEDDIGSAWISALRKVLSDGDDIKTEYDKETDFPAKDSTVLICVRAPFSNPILNKRSKEKKPLKVRSKAGNSYEAYGRIEDIFLIGSIQSNYIEEVLDGINDHLHNPICKKFSIFLSRSHLFICPVCIGRFSIEGILSSTIQ